MQGVLSRNHSGVVLLAIGNRAYRIEVRPSGFAICSTWGNPKTTLAYLRGLKNFQPAQAGFEPVVAVSTAT